MIRGSGGRISPQALYALCALAISMWGCGSHFRLDRSAAKTRSDGAIRLSCIGNPRRFAVDTRGVLYGIGNIQLRCLDERACSPKAMRDVQALDILAAGTWVEVSATQPGQPAHSSGVVCLNSSGVLAGSCSDDNYVLDFIVDCPAAVAQSTTNTTADPNTAFCPDTQPLSQSLSP
jgi:hypothetical protein